MVIDVTHQRTDWRAMRRAIEIRIVIMIRFMSILSMVVINMLGRIGCRELVGHAVVGHADSPGDGVGHGTKKLCSFRDHSYSVDDRSRPQSGLC